MSRQPRAVWAVAFACVIAFMGIGLVDPILKSIADELGATGSEVSLLFTSYLIVMGLMMLVTGAVSRRLGAKRTLLLGLVIIIVGAGAAGLMDSVLGIVAFRAVWGLGNSLFIATALASIVSSARGSVGQAIILYEAALGLGIAAGPLLGGLLGGISWRGPFFGVSVLMALALVATAILLPEADRPSTTEDVGGPRPRVLHDLAAPLVALRHPGLAYVAVTAMLYNFGFFTLLAFTPFLLDMGPHAVGLVFFGWGLMLAFTSVVVAPRLQRALGTIPTAIGNLACFAFVLAAMAVWTDNQAALVICVVVAGAFLGINNTLVTETVMKAAAVDRPVASAAYSFVRFMGGAVAPWAANKLAEKYLDVHLPLWVGAGAVLLGALVLFTGRRYLAHVDLEEGHGAPEPHTVDEAEYVTVGDS